MNLQAKVLPKYFDELKSGKKTSELRQFETMTLINSETGEQLCFDVVSIIEHADYTGGAYSRKRFERTKVRYSDVKWDETKPIYLIKLGARKL